MFLILKLTLGSQKEIQEEISIQNSFFIIEYAYFKLSDFHIFWNSGSNQTEVFPESDEFGSKWHHVCIETCYEKVSTAMHGIILKHNVIWIQMLSFHAQSLGHYILLINDK